MNELITNNFLILGTILIVIAGLIFLLQTKYKSQAAGMLLFLCHQAETSFGPGTGPFKFSLVLTWVYEKLPPLAKLLITKKQMENMIEYAVKKMKEYLLTIETDKINLNKHLEDE